MSKIKYINKLTESNVLSYEQVYVISVPDLINTGSTSYNEYCYSVLNSYNVSSDETLNSFLMKRNFSDEVKLITNNIINLHNTDVEYDRVYDIAEDAVTMDELSPIVNILYYDLVTLKDSSGLTTGITYFITDREIWIKALSTSELSLNGHRRMRVVKSDNYVPSGTILGVWNATLTPSINDVVVWGGKVWLNILGNVGTAVDETSLDPLEWNGTIDLADYDDKLFKIIYDFDNDWVASQTDDRGNTFGVSFILATTYGLTYNPCDISDWGHLGIVDNTAIGIFNNSNTGAIERNISLGYIQNNSNNGDINQNSNKGGIVDNSNQGSISQNNTGDIIANSNAGEIERNTCIGGILNNSNEGVINRNVASYIANNSCSGVSANIIDNVCLSFIQANNNVGQISNNKARWISYNSNSGYINNNNVTTIENQTSNVTDIESNSCNNISTNDNVGAISYNSCPNGVYGNSNTGDIIYNSNTTAVYDNSNTGGITGNSNIGDICLNSNAGAISGNNNTGSICENTNNGDITVNSCGEISLNSIDGYISFNTNFGGITSNTQTSGTCNISYNNNNGSISGARTVDIIGVVVDL